MYELETVTVLYHSDAFILSQSECVDTHLIQSQCSISSYQTFSIYTRNTVREII